MKKPETMKSKRDKGQAKKKLKELWDNKGTRWIYFAFATVIFVMLLEYILLAVK